MSLKLGSGCCPRLTALLSLSFFSASAQTRVITSSGEKYDALTNTTAPIAPGSPAVFYRLFY